MHQSLFNFLVLLVGAHLLPFLFSDLGGRDGGTDRTGDRPREEKQEVVITTPWPPGSLGLR